MSADLRKMTEQSLEQMRTAVNGYLQFFQRGVPGMPMLGGAELSNKVMSYTERNVASAFEFAQGLLSAKDPQEILRLQTEFLQAQIQAMTEQVKDLSETAMKAVSDTAKGGRPGASS
ncbi:hypothetical protein A33M_0147 [Rhodovulum sp. PH10]|nr:hypothetical protein A33M_0147 [Rhodovulum sp. PH10]